MRIVLSIIGCILSLSARACPDVLGEWHSSANLSKAFNDKHAVIAERTKEFRSQLIGKSTVTYTDGVVTLEMEPINEVTINGNKYPWESTRISSPYEVLGCTENVLVLKVTINGIDVIDKLNFENKDIYWVYEGMPSGTGNDHTREYFQRAKDN